MAYDYDIGSTGNKRIDKKGERRKQMKIWKRFASALLAAAMMLSVTIPSVFAVDSAVYEKNQSRSIIAYNKLIAMHRGEGGIDEDYRVGIPIGAILSRLNVYLG